MSRSNPRIQASSAIPRIGRHTPLSAAEEIPWGGKRLVVGTGADGGLPVMDEVLAEAKRRGIKVIAAPTSKVCQLLDDVKKGQAYAILHCTC